MIILLITTTPIIILIILTIIVIINNNLRIELFSKRKSVERRWNKRLAYYLL